jgi:hypothetical protein
MLTYSRAYDASAAEPVTVAEAADYLRLIDLDDEDAVLSRLITYAREFAETYCRAAYKPQTVTAQGWLGQGVTLPLWSVGSAVAQITITGSGGGVVAQDPSKFVVSSEGVITSTGFGSAVGTVVYSAGSACPETVKRAITYMVSALYEGRDNRDMDEDDVNKITRRILSPCKRGWF